MNKRYTIKDIARMANVSVSTVSRVLNNASDVNDETRNRITRIIRTLNYNPNPAAMALVNRQSKYIAVVIPNVHHYAHSVMVQGIMDTMHEAGFDVLLFDYNESSEQEARYYSTLQKKMIDGIIMITSIAPDESIVSIAEKIPAVLIEREVDSPYADSVLIDEDDAMLKMVRYLKSMGHTRIGLINGEEGTTSAEYRSRSFRKTLSLEKLDFRPPCIQHTDWSLKGGKKALISLVDQGFDCTALICASDQLALGALGGAYEKNLHIPEDLSIVGFDNFEGGEISIPPLTTLDFPSREMGQMAANLILERIESNRTEPEKRILRAELLVRESVKDLN